MTPPRVAVYATHRPFRTACDALLRDAGAPVRVASRQAELVKAIGKGTIAVIIAGDDCHDVEVARAVAATSAAVVTVLQRAPGESIEEIVARALAATTPAPAPAMDQPRSSK